MSPRGIGIYPTILVSLVLSAGCGGAGGGVSPVSGVFIATASDGKTLAAIRVDDPVHVDPPADAGSTTGQRSISVLLTDGKGTNLTFGGKIGGNDFDLGSTMGAAEITGHLEGTSASASLIHGAPSVLTFQAHAASAGTGLFLVALKMPIGSTPGTVQGFSEGPGPQFLIAGTIASTFSGNSYAVTGTITTQGGTPSSFSAYVQAGSSGDQFWIISSDGSVHGTSEVGMGTGFTAPTPF